MKTLRILLADDHSVMREGLALLIDSQPDMRVVAQAADGREACEKALVAKPTVAVLDLAMPGMNGLEAAQVMRRTCPMVKVLALSMHEDESYLRELLKVQAHGYVLKRSAGEELIEAIRKVAGGEVYFDNALATRTIYNEQPKQPSAGIQRKVSLTRKEETVLRLIALGFTNKEIAAKLSLSPKTIEHYKSRFGRKLGMRGRAEIVRFALRRGWLKDEDGGLAGETTLLANLSFQR